MYLNPYTYVKSNICKYIEPFTSANKETLIKLSKCVGSFCGTVSV